MKVREAIEALKRYDPELNLITDGYEGGYIYISEVKPLKIATNVHDSEYIGPHEKLEEVLRTFKLDSSYYKDWSEDQVEDSVYIG